MCLQLGWTAVKCECVGLVGVVEMAVFVGLAGLVGWLGWAVLAGFAGLAGRSFSLSLSLSRPWCLSLPLSL